MRSTATPKTSLRWLGLPLGAALLATFTLTAWLTNPPGARAEEPKGGDLTKKEEAPKPGDAEKKEGEEKKPAPVAKKRATLLPVVLANPKPFEDIVDAARAYFDLEKEHWLGRKAFVSELEAQAKSKHWFLKDMPALRWLVYQGRSFRDQMTDRKWQRSQGITEAKSIGGTLNYIKSDDLSITYSIPRKYPKAKDFANKYPRIDPLPLLLTMHERRDYAEKHPGKALLKRRYGEKKVWDALYKEWLILAPMAPAGKFVTSQGEPRAEVFQNPFSVFWKHYHMDFDRVILDGTEDAFTMASSMPIFFAGVVFRGKDWKLTDAHKAMVKNFASVGVFVVDNPALAKQLEEAGHPNVTKGIANKTMLKWMTDQRRVAPKNFSWNAVRPDQALPYWVNLDGANWGAPKREITVAVVDEKDEPNTINIQAVGIDTFTLFLNDDIVDLDRKVRVVVNGHIQHDEVLKVQDKRIEVLGRDFDFLFNRDPLVIRKSMYFGWLTPSRIVRVVVRKAEVKKPVVTAKAPKDEGPKASPKQEVAAERLMAKVKEFIKKGLTDKAVRLLDKICAMPTNKQTTHARKLKKELGK